MLNLVFLHGRRDSNSRHLVLETSALPTELHPYFFSALPPDSYRESYTRIYFATANIIIHSKLPEKIKKVDW